MVFVSTAEYIKMLIKKYGMFSDSMHIIFSKRGGTLK